MNVATALLASNSMNSSISLCASFRTLGTTASGLPFLIQFEFYFGAFKVHGAFVEAFFAQFKRQFIQQL